MPLYNAVKNSKDGLVHSLLLSQANPDWINPADEDGDSLVGISAKTGKIPPLKWLLMFGANFRRPNRHGSAPLHEAVKAGSVLVVQLLVAANADPRQKDRDGRSALALAKSTPKAESCIAALEGRKEPALPMDDLPHKWVFQGLKG